MSIVTDMLSSVSKLGNRVFSPILNIIFSGSHEFGHTDETISSVLGSNIKENRCILCHITCSILNLFDKDHCTKSIKDKH